MDGLRGVAVLLVVGFHAAPGLFVAGSYGVTIFLVLSGFLITRILAAEKDRTGSLSFSSFYRRRAIRLLPALFIVAMFAFLIGEAWQRVVLPLVYASNYSALGGFHAGLLNHTWSLSVEEHFYLVWPFVFGFIPASSRRKTIQWLLVAAVAYRSVVLLAGASSWVYWGTDTNAFAILAGCWLATLPIRSQPRGGWAAAILVGVAFVPTVAHQTTAYFWGSLAVVALTVVAIRQSVGGVEWLRTPVLMWFGKVSYGLYLWHHVLILSPLPTWPAVALSILLAGLMWHSLEKPLLDRKGRRKSRSLRPTGLAQA